MKKGKSLGIILGVTIMSTITTGCASSATGTKPAETQAEPKAFSYTKMQELMATKAVKFTTENNPIVAYKFAADPAVLVYNDTVYIYATNDMQQFEKNQGKSSNGYGDISTLNVFSSKDLVNWTNHGEIKVAGRRGGNGEALWSNNSWAPAIATKKIDGVDKFFLYFADNGSGIGVLTADSPLGPFKDPLDKQLISRSTPNTEGVYWLFDPAVFVDDDGTGYLYYGGGHPDDKAEHPKSGRCVQLGDDMISIVGTPQEIDAPFLFEDSGINKINGKYVYSYCANWVDRKNYPDAPEKPEAAAIAYMTSDSPLGPFKYQGITLRNPGIYFGPWGNNHHWIFQFKNKWYIAYHAQVTEKKLGLPDGVGGFRNIFLNEFKVNDDGSIPVQPADAIKMAGVTQIGTFNPYDEIPAATLKCSVNLAIREDIKTGKQIVIPAKKDGYLLLNNVDFSEGASKVVLNIAAGSKTGSVKFCLDHFAHGEVIAEADFTEGGKIEAAVTLPEGEKVRDLYLVFNGDFALESYQFMKN